MEDVRTSLVMTARTMVEKDPNYSYVTARLLMDTLRSALNFLASAKRPTIRALPICGHTEALH